MRGLSYGTDKKNDFLPRRRVRNGRCKAESVFGKDKCSTAPDKYRKDVFSYRTSCSKIDRVRENVRRLDEKEELAFPYPGGFYFL